MTTSVYSYPMEAKESESATFITQLQDSLAAKNKECEELRAQVEELNIKQEFQRQEFIAQQAELQAKCDELQSQLHISNVNASWLRRTASSAAASAVSDMTDLQTADDMTDSDGESSPSSFSASPSSPTKPDVSCMRKAHSASDVTVQQRFLETADRDPGDYSRFNPQGNRRKNRHSLSGPQASAPSPALQYRKPRDSDDQLDEAAVARIEADALTRVRETHRKCGDRNIGGFLREMGIEVDGSGWNPTEEDFERIRKRGLVLCHPDKQMRKSVRERCLYEAIFKELNEWTYKPPLDRPGNGFASHLRNRPASSALPLNTSHRRPGSHMGTSSSYSSLGYATGSASSIASRLVRHSMDARLK